MNGGEILLYQTEDGASHLDVRLVNETVWLSAGQMAELFQRDKSTISRQILTHAGKISAEAARLKAEAEYEEFNRLLDSQPSPVENHFQQVVEQTKHLEDKVKPRKKKGGAS